MKLCGMKLTSLGEQQKQQTFASFVLHRFVKADFHATQGVTKACFVSLSRLGGTSPQGEHGAQELTLLPSSNHRVHKFHSFPFSNQVQVSKSKFLNVDTGFHDISWVSGKIEKPKSRWAWTCLFRVTSLVSKPGNWQLLKVTQKLHRHPISGCLKQIMGNDDVNRLKLSGRETNICLSAFDLNWLKSCEPEEWKSFWLAPGCSQLPLASQLVLLHLLLCQSLSYCLQLCLSDHAFPQALSLQKQRHVPMFPSVCAASSASLMDTCQKDSAQTLGQTPQTCVTSRTFSTLILCPPAQLAAMPPSRPRGRYCVQSLSKSKSPIPSYTRLRWIWMPSQTSPQSIKFAWPLFSWNMFEPHQWVLWMHWILKAKTDHIHCNLARLRVLSLISRTDFDGKFGRRGFNSNAVWNRFRVGESHSAVFALIKAFCSASVHLRFSDVSQALSCSLPSRQIHGAHKPQKRISFPRWVFQLPVFAASTPVLQDTVGKLTYERTAVSRI